VMNKYNVKAIRHQLDAWVACRNWSAFRKRFVALLPSHLKNDCEVTSPQDDKYPVLETFQTFSSISSETDRHKVEFCRAVVELKKSSGHQTGLTERCPSLLHELCLNFYSKGMVSSRHKHPPVPLDILEMVAQVSSRKVFLTRFGKRRRTPLALLLENCPPAYVVERMLTIMTQQLEDNKESISERLQVLYIQDLAGDTPLMQAVKRLSDQDDIIKVLVDFDAETLQSLLLCGSKAGSIPLYYLLHRELKYLDRVEQISCQTIVNYCNMQQQELSQNLLFLLLKTQQAILVGKEFLYSSATVVWNE
jgi:hypothetical protein